MTDLNKTKQETRSGLSDLTVGLAVSVNRKCTCAGCSGNCAGHNCEICCGYACSGGESQNDVQAAAGGLTQTPL